MEDIYENIDAECNTNEKHKILMIFDATIADMLSIKKFLQIVT